MAMGTCVYVPVKLEEDDQRVIRPDHGNHLLTMKEGCTRTPAFLENDAKSFRVDQGRRPSFDMSRRLASLDVFRGLTVVLMIIVDDAGGVLPAINHSPWDGVTLADFVFPFFLFMVGVSIGLAYKKLPSKLSATRKAIFRALKLVAIGLFVQGGFLHGVNDLSYGVDINKIRWMGVLQRIAITYLVTALCEIWLKGEEDPTTELVSLFSKYKIQWVLTFIITTIYLALLYGLYIPDWEFQVPSTVANSSAPITFSVKCSIRGDTSPACNAVGMIDRKVLGINHMYRRPIYIRTEQCSTKSPDYGPLPLDAPSWCQAPFDPEGLLSSMMAIVTTLIGLHFGHIIVHYKDHNVRVARWSITASGLLIKGLILNFSGIALNKALYSLSYTCVTAGVGGILFAAVYLLVDVYEYRRPTIVLEWVGAHALKIYVIVACNIWLLILQGFYSEEPGNNIMRLIGATK
ncbi:heparan-alpha-glucosaminide N-acetyltransferase-like isoform X1 [Punica granatum]|uniref:Heparan-alpha-glucosaminide N-acetyltransferase-like isoform X1 n=2 Tax=Punica granatum TaxID=22663 RepID=A0A6P8D0S3_PUNGR|nr:heparan-alpha-glucosaminide N-acetyltransferase-like isoform X1 [Punica granatum]